MSSLRRGVQIARGVLAVERRALGLVMTWSLERPPSTDVAAIDRGIPHVVLADDLQPLFL